MSDEELSLSMPLVRQGISVVLLVQVLSFSSISGSTCFYELGFSEN